MDEFTRGAGIVVHRTDIPVRGGTRSPNAKHMLFGKQEGRCAGCEREYSFKDMEVYHNVSKFKGGHDIDENPQLLCGHCTRAKGKGKTMPELKATLVGMGVLGRRAGP